MKTKFMILIGAMLVSVMGIAQVEFKNSSSADIKVSSIDGLNTVEIGGKQAANVSFLNETAGTVTAKIQHSAYQPGASYVWLSDGEMTFAVKNGVATFSSPKQKQAIANTEKPVKTEKKVTKTEKTQTEKTQSNETKTSSTSTKNETKKEVSLFLNNQVTFFVQNCCTMTITGYSGLLDGLCLKTNQVSKTKVTASTGTIQSAIGYDTDPDKTATGANQKWAVLYKAIPENVGDKIDTLKIYNENLVLVNTGVPVTKRFDNRTNIGYLITNGAKNLDKNSPAEDKTVAPNSSRKMKLYLGWNVLTFQYLDENGLPRQAVLLFMVTKDQKSVTLTKKSGVGNSIADKDLKIE